MADRCKKGLCFNSDETYVHAHKCDRVFYLESPEYIMEELNNTEGLPAAPPFDPNVPMISLSAITGIQFVDTIQLRI